jgi:hypothetical protein
LVRVIKHLALNSEILDDFGNRAKELSALYSADASYNQLKKVFSALIS